jgi:hypothetical protein
VEGRALDEASKAGGAASARAAWTLVLLGLVSAGMLSPLASGDLAPGAYDFSQHLYLITQAADGFAEGQLPVRVAPAMNGGLSYPVFQFYSPLPYQLAGALERWVTPQDPWVPYRLLAWLALWCGAAFTWRLARRLTGSELGALLAAVAYVTAPYVLVNLHARAAWPETIAQGLLPAVLWYAFRLFEDGDVRAWVGSAVSWALLAQTHLITFAYAALLAGVLFLCVAAADGRRSLGGLARLAGALAIGCALSWWHLEPVLLTPLAVKLAGVPSPFESRWLSPLLTLLSPVSLPPEPEPGRLSLTAPGLHASVGWVLLAATAWAVHALARRELARPARARVAGLLAVFAVSFVLAWSPVNIWRALPSILSVVQFPYRLLAHTAWSGALLLAFGIAALYPEPRLDARRVLVGTLAVVLASSSWLRVEGKLEPLKISELVAIRKETSYLPGSRDIVHMQEVGYQVPVAAVRPSIWTGSLLVPPDDACAPVDGAMRCQVVAPEPTITMLPAYWYPGGMVRVEVNGAPVEPVPIESRLGAVVGAPVPRGPSVATVRFRGSARADAVSLGTAVALLGVSLAAWLRGRRRAAASIGTA